MPGPFPAPLTFKGKALGTRLDVLCQFVTGIKTEQREILIKQDDLLRTPVETIIWFSEPRFGN